jgi:hypothetical protein
VSYIPRNSTRVSKADFGIWWVKGAAFLPFSREKGVCIVGVWSFRIKQIYGQDFLIYILILIVSPKMFVGKLW